LAKLQARAWLSHALCGPGQHSAKDEETARDNHILACNSAKYLPIKKFTDRLSNKSFQIWLLTTPPHLQYVATLPCNLSSMARFADINVSQGSVSTYARCGGILNIHLTTNLQRNLAVKKNFNRLRFDRIMVMSLWPNFLANPVYSVKAPSQRISECREGMAGLAHETFIHFMETL